MHRMKIGLVAPPSCWSSPGVHSVVTKKLKETVIQEVETEVSRAQRMHQSIARLEALDFANLVAGLSHRAGVVGVFDKTDETARRQAAFEQCEDVNAFLQKGGSRKADIVVIIDSAGKVVARDLNVNAMYGEDLRSKYPAVALALRGEATKDIWTFSNRMTRVAVAPIATRTAAEGALLVGYVIDARDAQLKRDLLGRRSATSTTARWTPRASSPRGSATAPRKTATRRRRSTPCSSSGREVGPGGGAEEAATELFHFPLDGREYAAVAAPLQGNAFDKTSGVVVLKSISSDILEVSGVGVKIIGFGVLAILVALGASVMTALRFIKPLDKIELGVAEIINGNIDYMFKPVGQDFEGLSNGLNVMMARLLGRDEPNEDEVEDEADEANSGSRSRCSSRRFDAVGGPSNDPEAAALARRTSRSTSRASSTSTSRRSRARASPRRASPSRPSRPSCASSRAASSRSGSAAWSASASTPRATRSR